MISNSQNLSSPSPSPSRSSLCLSRQSPRTVSRCLGEPRVHPLIKLYPLSIINWKLIGYHSLEDSDFLLDETIEIFGAIEFSFH